MKFTLAESLEILKKTPYVLESMLSGLPKNWIYANEGEETWSPFDIVGHLIHGEKTDWIPRMEIILSEDENKTFTPFDRFAQFKESKGKTLDQLLLEFKELRKRNLEILKSKDLTVHDFSKRGMHPALGETKLSQLLSTWVVHDLNHISQIARVMAKQYKEEVGPWVEYLRILQ